VVEHAPTGHQVKLMSGLRLLADHGQFFACDASVDPWGFFPDITEDTARLGWARTDAVVYYFTVGQLWDFRLDVFRDEEPPGLENADRVLSHTIRLPTGVLTVGNPVADHNLVTLSLEPGEYSLFLRAFNLGVESEEQLTDEEVFSRADLERYELFVVPGAAATEGVILGRSTLW
jgi:hypothetical protein